MTDKENPDGLLGNTASGNPNDPPSTPPQRLNAEALFNVNHHVRIKITAAGREHLRKRDRLWKMTPGYSTAVDDRTGYAEWQLWDVMATFGDAMFNGCDVPFETEIVIVPDQW